MQVEILRRLVAFDTALDREREGIMDYIEGLMVPYGFSVRRVGQNLILNRGDSPRVGFLGHTDTVLKSEGWDGDPLVLEAREGFLYGLGACDMKGGIAAFLSAAVETDEPVALYLTYDEEVDLKGVRELVEAGEEFPPLLIVAEPTDLVPVVATKGPLEFHVTFRGLRVHSSRPDEGRSAIYDATEFIGALRRYLEELKSETEELFEIPYTTGNVGLIQGGTTVNSTPDLCTLSIDFRTIRAEQRVEIETKIRELLEPYDASYEIGVDVAPFINDSDVSEIERLCGSKKKAENYFTEASYIPAEKTRCVILGPGPMSAHEANEHISEESLKRTAEVFKGIIRNANA